MQDTKLRCVRKHRGGERCACPASAAGESQTVAAGRSRQTHRLALWAELMATAAELADGIQAAQADGALDRCNASAALENLATVTEELLLGLPRNN